MCVLALGFQLRPDLPVILAANRDEFYARPAEPPHLLRASPRIVGGLDVRAGGTWFGVNEHGVIVALTNRYLSAEPQPVLPTSRGQLCLDALLRRTPREAAQFVADSANHAIYNPFSLMTAGVGEAWFVGNIDDAIPRRLSAGWHFLANGALDDPHDPRVAHAAALAPAIRVGSGPQSRLVAALATFCRDHGSLPDGTGGNGLCVHRAQAGTRSAAILFLATDGHVTYLHADGPPCETEFVPVRLPWQKG